MDSLLYSNGLIQVPNFLSFTFKYIDMTYRALILLIQAFNARHLSSLHFQFNDMFVEKIAYA